MSQKDCPNSPASPEASLSLSLQLLLALSISNLSCSDGSGGVVLRRKDAFFFQISPYVCRRNWFTGCPVAAAIKPSGIDQVSRSLAFLGTCLSENGFQEFESSLHPQVSHATVTSTDLRQWLLRTTTITLPGL